MTGLRSWEDSVMETTAEQRAAVARDGCRVNGHTFQEVITFGRLAPQRVICRDCGSSWRIHPDDVERDFGGGT